MLRPGGSPAKVCHIRSFRNYAFAMARPPSANTRLGRVIRYSPFTVAEIAERAEMSERLLTYFTTGERTPRPDQIRRLAAALDVDPAVLHEEVMA
jgi:transcriptional regulator with XRE-family HTH domain